MDRNMLVDHLEQAQRHVALGEQHIERQRQLVRELERDGHPTEDSRALLQTFEDLQTQHVADRDRLMAELRQD